MEYTFLLALARFRLGTEYVGNTENVPLRQDKELGCDPILL